MHGYKIYPSVDALLIRTENEETTLCDQLWTTKTSFHNISSPVLWSNYILSKWSHIREQLAN